jgi:glycosyltransferase involved in cell wall biosynthesis
MDPHRLKVAFVGGRGIVGTYSGIETYYEEVGARLAERGHEVTAYCREYFTPDVAAHRGIRIRRLPCLRTKHLETISHSVLATLASLVRDFDIVQYHAVGSAPLAALPRLFGRTTIVSVRGLDWQRAKWGPFARGVLKLGEWASVHFPTATVVVSQTLQRHYAEQHGRHTYCIPNAVVLPERRPAEGIQRFGLEPGEYLLYAGRISPEKGLHTLLEALRPLPRRRKLVLAGGSSYSQGYIEELKAKAWDDVLFLGNVDHATVEALYSNCYAFILPSTMEGLSISLLEALSFGACIVTTDIPENREVVGSAALTFPPGDVEALRAILAGLLEQPERAAEYRERAIAHARLQPDWDEVARRTEALYLHLLSGAHVPQADFQVR